MNPPRVLVMDSREETMHLYAPLRELADVDILPPDQGEMERLLPDYDAFVIPLGVSLDQETIRRCKRLRFVATCTTGTDHMDVGALEENGIELISLKYDTEFLSTVPATAEMAWALLLAVVRRLPAAFDSVRNGEWDRESYAGMQLRDRTFGILGYGRLGQIIQDFALGFHMRVLACDVRDVQPTREGVAIVDLDTLLRESEILSLHIHLTEENRHFLNRERIQRMRPGAIVINTSRGAVLDQNALLEALESGHLGGAGLDVLEGEWECDLARHPLVRYARSHDNLVISPHTGGCCLDAREKTLAHTVGKLCTALRNGG